MRISWILFSLIVPYVVVNSESLFSTSRVESFSPLNVANSCNSTFDNLYPGEALIFCDDFAKFDLSVWEHEITMGGGGNWEFELYHNNRSNSFVSDSVLYIKPTLVGDMIGEENVKGNNYYMDLWGSTQADSCTGNAFYGCSRTSGAGGNIINPIQSAAVRTSSSFSFKYGRVEVRAKLPKGDWLWPAIWMLPRYNMYGNWPSSGEIDIMESRGNDPSYPSGGVDSFGSTLHFGPNWQADGWPKAHAEFKLNQGTLNDDFHIYGVKWTKDMIYTYFDVDDESHRILSFPLTESLWTVGGWDKTSYFNPWFSSSDLSTPFNEEFYLIFNVAVGGTNSYWPDGQGNKPWTNSDAHAVNNFYAAKDAWLQTWGTGNQNALQIDWVRVYQ